MQDHLWGRSHFVSQYFIQYGHLPWHQIKPCFNFCSLSPATHPCKEPGSISLIISLQLLPGCHQVPSKHSLLQAGGASFPPPLLKALVHQPSQHHLGGPHWTHLNLARSCQCLSCTGGPWNCTQNSSAQLTHLIFFPLTLWLTIWQSYCFPYNITLKRWPKRSCFDYIKWPSIHIPEVYHIKVDITIACLTNFQYFQWKSRQRRAEFSSLNTLVNLYPAFKKKQTQSTSRTAVKVQHHMY